MAQNSYLKNVSGLVNDDVNKYGRDIIISNESGTNSPKQWPQLQNHRSSQHLPFKPSPTTNWFSSTTLPTGWLVINQRLHVLKPLQILCWTFSKSQRKELQRGVIDGQDPSRGEDPPELQFGQKGVGEWGNCCLRELTGDRKVSEIGSKKKQIQKQIKQEQIHTLDTVSIIEISCEVGRNFKIRHLLKFAVKILNKRRKKRSKQSYDIVRVNLRRLVEMYAKMP